ncbi:alpha/beta hydrolase family protein [Nocardia tenerifensis]|uniref:Alpha/beta hydrolase family protein n=2 Tax=Nocardia tenerifensis TaxID=228006 RepID=A0A318JUY4_9NOCA|nr:alpha/beta hydrolase family protein [Nocardia tenerifensis]PXX59744.1 alpha/beta hydrolase family protein [Nocardia tenerifensis]
MAADEFDPHGIVVDAAPGGLPLAAELRLSGAAEEVAPVPQVRRIALVAGELTLSALLCAAEHPRAVIVALHGAGTSAHYFDGRAHPDVSLLTLGARLGYTVLAIDRPGYPASAAEPAAGQSISRQARTIAAALHDFRAKHAVGQGFCLLGHSFGSAVAMTMAADPADCAVLGLDISGWGARFANSLTLDTVRLHWGALRLYPPGTFRSGVAMLGPVPPAEHAEAYSWTTRFADVAARIPVPVRFTFAEYEAMWRQDAEAVRELRAAFRSAPTVLVERQLGAGHNISLGWAARSYHLRSLGFFEECLTGRGAS